MVPKVKYFSLEGCDSPAITRTSHGQIIGSNELTLGVCLGGTVLFLLVKREEAETNWVHLSWLGILVFLRMCWS